MSGSKQIPFDLAQPVSFDLADFMVSPCNSAAFNFVEAWATAPFHFAAIVGPSGSGKSHMLHGWGVRNGATVLLPETELANIAQEKNYIIDDVDQLDRDGEYAYSDEFLFHAYNWSKERGAKVLVTAREAPSRWSRQLPDLVSRLGTLPVAIIHEPDDEILQALLIKLFSDKQLQVDLQVISYLVSRMPRSYAAVNKLTADMDRLALAEQRRITKDLARRCLEQL